MSKIEVKVEVSKETYELGQGLVDVAKSVVDAKKDGWQAGQDIPAIIVSLFAQMSAIEGVEKIDDEMKSDPAAFGKALALSLADAYAELGKKEEAE